MIKKRSLLFLSLLIAQAFLPAGKLAAQDVSITGEVDPAPATTPIWDLGNLNLVVGKKFDASLSISGMGAVTNRSAFIGEKGGSNGIATVSGGTWTNSNDLFVGDRGVGSLTISGTGQVSSANTIIANRNGSTGALQFNGGVLSTGQLRKGSGTGSMSFNGGGIYNTGTLTINSSTLSGNTGTNGSGIYNTGTLTINSSSLSNNTGTNGVGIYNTGTLTIGRSTLSGNLGDYGAGVYNVGALTIHNSTFSKNTASIHGGGIYLASASTLTLVNSTLSDNDAMIGGGIYNDLDSTLNSTNSIIAGNTRSGSPTTFFRANISNSINSGNANLTSGNPRLFPLGDYGGPTQTMPPVEESPAINQGDNASVAGIYFYDQRGSGFNRISGGTVDIGAYEVQQNTPLLDWRVFHGLDPAGADDDGNPSGDGIANILKYAFNMAPNPGDLLESNRTVMTRSGEAGLPLVGVDGAPRLVLTYVRRRASTNPGVSYQPHTGSDLASGLNPLTDGFEILTLINDEWERVTVVDPTSSPLRFGYIEVITYP